MQVPDNDFSFHGRCALIIIDSHQALCLSQSLLVSTFVIPFPFSFEFVGSRTFRNRGQTNYQQTIASGEESDTTASGSTNLHETSIIPLHKCFSQSRLIELQSLFFPVYFHSVYNSRSSLHTVPDCIKEELANDQENNRNRSLAARLLSADDGLVGPGARA